MTPRVYIACLASYNNGVLHGRWIDADQEPDEIQEEINEMLRESRFPNTMVECPECEGTDDECELCKGTGEVPSAEEWAVHDYDEMINLGEYPSLDDISRHGLAIAEHGDAWKAFCDHFGDDVTEEQFQDAYCGQYRSEVEYAEQLVDDCYNIDEMMGNLSHYFDYEKFARDLFISDYYRDDDTGHVFRRDF
ncbi:antirestriction protein ArdA [Bremerella sp. P1]|uniref:antirestriction protein ArdA n=1 Tax=Bremerella sp. P1 TaxID=3026424 RepID=UPI002368B39C|nr:antirestriction protein ArdA [Bremerella sp. P1]WDI44794.1 antirestriction protein ArdA [Bremerella sp. P1]